MSRDGQKMWLDLGPYTAIVPLCISLLFYNNVNICAHAWAKPSVGNLLSITINFGGGRRGELNQPKKEAYIFI